MTNNPVDWKKFKDARNTCNNKFKNIETFLKKHRKGKNDNNLQMLHKNIVP